MYIKNLRITDNFPAPKHSITYMLQVAVSDCSGRLGSRDGKRLGFVIYIQEQKNIFEMNKEVGMLLPKKS